jgi:hypothetical protein
VPNTYSVSIAYSAKDTDIDALVGDLIARHNACFTRWLSGMSFEIEASLSNARELASEPQVNSVIEMEEIRARRSPVPPESL